MTALSASLLLLALIAPFSIAQAPGQMQNIVIQSGGLSRNFYLFLPSSWTPASEPVPVVLNWHGFTSNAQEQAAYSRTNDYAQEYGWAMAYPEGIQNSFNGGACCGEAADSRVDDVQFARDIITAIESRGVGVRRDAVFSIGMSNGGFMSHRLACEASDLVSAIGPNAARRAFGNGFDSCDPVRSIPVIAITGTNDLLVPYEGTATLASFAQDQTNARNVMSCDPNEPPLNETITSSSTCQVYSQCDRGTFIEYCTVQGGAHVWFYAPTDIDSTGYFFMRFAQITPGLVPKPFLNLKPELEPRFPKYIE